MVSVVAKNLRDIRQNKGTLHVCLSLREGKEDGLKAVVHPVPGTPRTAALKDGLSVREYKQTSTAFR